MDDNAERGQLFKRRLTALDKTDVFWQAFIACLCAQAVVELFRRLSVW